jgi:type I restriction enzyme S subunit
MGNAKKQGLNPEEFVEHALVPVGEQLYPVPENWTWVYLIDGFAECLDHFRKPINAAERADRVGRVPYYGATGQVGWIDEYLTDEHLVLVGEDGAPFLDKMKDKAYIISGPAWVNNHAHVLRSRFGECGNIFLMHYLNTFDYRGFVNGTTRLKLTQGSMRKIPVVLPPLAEQQRIVDRIESVFAKLDQAKELVQNALDTFETRKAAILHKAFTGELTAKWREENGVGMESWKKTALERLGSLERGRSRHRPRNAPELFGGPYPFIQTGDVANADVYVTSHKQSLSEVGLRQSRLFPKGTLCITIAANIGDVAILSYDSCFPDSVVGFTPNQCTDAKFVYYKLTTLKAEIEASAPATAQKNINLKVLKDTPLQVPSLPEQQEIVRVLDSLCGRERQIRELVAGMDEIDLLKKAILARAFRGELGTNDPDEKSAIELLKQCVGATA